jgi:hypothetical protein
MKKRKRNSRVSFHQICTAAKPEILESLVTRAVFSNRMAKAGVSTQVRKAAYEGKSAALSRGIELRGFVLRSDDLMRHHLASVSMPGNRRLHIDIGGLSPAARRNPEVIATLGVAL